MSLHRRTLFITGASRGVGLAIALRAARDGANIAIAAMTDQPHPKLPGTIHTAAKAIEQAGGRALPLVVDIRDEGQVAAAVERTAEHFGGIDILVNNASAIRLSGTLDTAIKHFDLMHQVNARGTFLCTRTCLPHLLQADNPHVLTLSPPLNLKSEHFGPHLAYSLAKFGMSLCTLGLAEEFRDRGVAFNSLWPRTLLDTAAVRNLLGGEAMARRARRPEIMADAAHMVLTRPAREQTGQFLIDEAVLREAGVTDFSRYRGDPDLPESALQDDLFL
ncbi:citronellol/citronellal dehydrogenase [Alkalispirillum mobile]|uniref:Citronellol/citronellal dehydrogenase n=1 Tax=Alkalispirillum mobile TaxID=85925 RepID=A0A498BWX4_9GAMM|nr:NAD(P)-dependent oxidoreductase [Alkalispirillum mobile]RLK46806.1 citronellol/citronellal dehydrogenase [Alkalispirillum mobile]